MKTFEQVVAEAKEAEKHQTFKGETIADLRKVFEAIQSPKGWKEPWCATVHHSLVGIVLKAVEFFHADRAVVVGMNVGGSVEMCGNGYRAY